MDSDAALKQLSRIDHIVVLMMENRSFDHMLGYLSLPPREGGGGRTDIDGLRVPDQSVPKTEPAPPFSNDFNGERYYCEPVKTAGITKIQDPGHEGWEVGQQMGRGMRGFAESYGTTRAYQDPQDVMSYQLAKNVPIYDFLADEFAVLDRWFCSVPGSTWPNRLTSLTGEARSRDNKMPPIYNRHAFVRVLQEHPEVSWSWYSYDPGSLRLIDGRFRPGYEDHFAFVDKATLVQKRTFFKDAIGGTLPNVSWIDPNFVDLGGLQGANDDHPPTDLMSGQSLVAKVYAALAHSPQWASTMLVVVYDEHGGFYDHVDPLTMPAEFRARAEFGGQFGPRVPALVVSPLVEQGVAFGSSQGDEPSLLFDHTALIRTILLRFAGGSTEGLAPGPAGRIDSSSHLGHVLTNTGAARVAPDVPQRPQLEAVADWWAERIEYRLRYPMADSPALRELGVVDGPTGLSAVAGKGLAILGRVVDFFRKLLGGHQEPKRGAGPPAAVVTDVSELQQGVAAAAKHIRERKKLPSGQP